MSSNKSNSSVLQRLNTALEEGYEAKLTPEGRIYYVNHKSHTSSWLPPRENWTDNSGLPYGWETGVDANEKPYFINHVDKFTTRDDPRDDPDYIEPPQPREVELVRDPDKGFGFVAGSERPVVVRFVTEGGPSVEKLMPGDLILKINGEEVRRAPREKVIELVRSCKQSIVLTVCQPYSDSSRKSAILTAAKKAKLKNNPSRVRFADNILVDGTSVASQQSPQESYVPFMPNVLKVFLENGQTKSFKYDNKTTIKDVIHSLQDKLNISCSHHFSLVLQNMKSNTPGKMTLLQDIQTLAELAAKPGARHFRCLFRVAYVPRDAYDLLKEDPVAFEYFYLQCCNDVIHERFASEMKYDTALRLAALQIQQHAMSNNMGGKISIKAIEKETGLDKFVSHSLMETMKGKELRRMVSQYLKMNQNLTAPGQKQLTALQAKLHYLKIVSELKTFGSRVFMVTLLDQKTEAMVLVGPKSGISVVTNIKSYALSLLADFDQLDSLKVTKDGENMHRVDINVKSNNKIETIGLGLLTEDAQNFVSMVDGYYQIYVDRERQIVERTVGKNTSDPNVPPYNAQHEVLVSPWAYPEDLVSVVIKPEEEGGGASERVIDLADEPPIYEPNEEYLAEMKKNLIEQKTQVVIEPPPTISEPPDLSDIIALSSSPQKIRTDFDYEEGITSFGSRSPGILDESSSSLNSSFSSQGASFKTILTASGNSSRADSSIDLTTEYKPLTPSTPAIPINLVTFHATNNFDSNLDLAQSMRQQNGNNNNNNKSPPSSPASSGSKASSEASVEAADHLRKGLQHSMNGEAKGRMNGGLDLESDDADTPHTSPARVVGKLSRNSSVESALHSFGLHSPDMGQGADLDFNNPNDPEQTNNDTMSRMAEKAHKKRIYLDPDIIDLTLLPPPETPDDDSMLDFTEMSNFPPPIFSTPNSSNSTPVKEGGGTVPTLVSSSSFKHSRLERSASTGNCPDFLDSDIDSLIAQFIIPPPPSSLSSNGDNTDSKPHAFANSYSGAMPVHSDDLNHSETSSATNVTNSNDVDISEFSHLIIPPPPSATIPLSPKDDENITGGDEKVVQNLLNAGKLRSSGRHKRSSSLDLASIKAAHNQWEFNSTNRCKSMDANQNSSENSKGMDSGKNSSVESIGKSVGESPASVSEKLHSLLKSLPNFGTSLPRHGSDNNLVRTGSLRIQRSSSLDLNPQPSSPVPTSTTNKEPPTPAVSLKAKLSDSVPNFSRSASLRIKRMSAQNLSQSLNIGPSSGRNILERSNSETLVTAQTKSGSEKDLNKTSSSSGSESFASLKAKLKDYRDLLLNRNKSSPSKKYALDGKADKTLHDSTDSGKGSLRLTNSIRLKNPFGRRGSKTSDDGKAELSPSLNNSDNWELKEASSKSAAHDEETNAEPGEKKIPVVRDALGLNRPTLRPVSNTVLSQDSNSNEEEKDEEEDEEVKSRKNGPLKALQSVFGGGDQDNQHKEGVMGSSPSKNKSNQHQHHHYNHHHNHKQQQQQRHSHRTQSKDDLSMAASQTKEKMKANPYATIKMWRPTSMDNSASYSGDPNEELYQTFTNFDALRNQESHNNNNNMSNGITKPNGPFRTLNDIDPVTGRMPNSTQHSPQYQKRRVQQAPSTPPPLPPHSATQSSPTNISNGRKNSSNHQRQDRPSQTHGGRQNTSKMNGFIEIPRDYPSDSDTSTPRKVSFEDEVASKYDNTPLTNGKQSKSVSFNTSSSSLKSHSSPSPSHHPISRQSPPPPPLPNSPPPVSPKRTSAPSLLDTNHYQNSQDTSFSLVSDGATNSVKLVLSHRYDESSSDTASKDIERLLAELKFTMESLTTSRIDKNSAQLSMCLSELHTQTKVFIQEAKHFVSSANNSKVKLMLQLETAVHVLANLFLHGQACMLMMEKTHQAQHLGFHIIKAANAFKTTVSAASAASGRSLNDPQMKYLMRQATNLANLLAALLSAIKQIGV